MERLAARPPPAWSCCGGSPGMRRPVRRDRLSGRPGSARWSSAATQQKAPSRSSRLVFQKPALVGLNPVVIPPKPLCPAAGGGGAAPRLPGSAQQHARPVDQADRSSSPQRRPQKCNAIENRLLGGVVCRDGPFAHWSRLLAPPEHPVRSSAGPAAASAHRCSG